MHGGATSSHRRAAEAAAAEDAIAVAVAQLPRLGMSVETTGIDALSDALNRSYAMVQATGLRCSALEPAQWAQRDLSGTFLRPSVYLELYWRALETYARISKDCVALGIAAAAVDVLRRDAEQVQTLLQGFVQALGMSWDDEPVRLALVTAIDRLEGAP